MAGSNRPYWKFILFSWQFFVYFELVNLDSFCCRTLVRTLFASIWSFSPTTPLHKFTFLLSVSFFWSLQPCPSPRVSSEGCNFRRGTSTKMGGKFNEEESVWRKTPSGTPSGLSLILRHLNLQVLKGRGLFNSPKLVHLVPWLESLVSEQWYVCMCVHII